MVISCFHNTCRREALYTWKKRNGSKATYSKLMKIFEQAGYKDYADEVRRIVQLSNSETDDSSGSEEDLSQIKQPQTYPSSKLQPISQLPPVTLESAETHYVIVNEENFPEG